MKQSMKLRLALIVVLTAALCLSVVALAAPVKGKPADPSGKAKKTVSAAQYQYGKTRVALCHKGKTITIGAPAAKAHLRHGDKLGPC